MVFWHASKRTPFSVTVELIGHYSACCMDAARACEVSSAGRFPMVSQPIMIIATLDAKNAKSQNS